MKHGFQYFGLPPWGGSGLKYQLLTYITPIDGLPPWGGSGLKYVIVPEHRTNALVSLLGEGVD